MLCDMWHLRVSRTCNITKLITFTFKLLHADAFKHSSGTYSKL